MYYNYILLGTYLNYVISYVVKYFNSNVYVLSNMLYVFFQIH